MEYELLFGKPQIALSFSGQDRAQVEAIAKALCDKLGERQVFYDFDFSHALVGDDADRKLRYIYGQGSELVVVFVSDTYAKQHWTELEHREIRAFEGSLRGPVEKLRIVPVRIGRGPMPQNDGVDVLPSSTIYYDVTEQRAEDTASWLHRRLQLYRSAKEQIAENTASAKTTQHPTSYFIGDCPDDPRCLEARRRIVSNLTAHKFAVWPPADWRYYSDETLARACSGLWVVNRSVLYNYHYASRLGWQKRSSNPAVEKPAIPVMSPTRNGSFVCPI